jgi:hypothetical protein
LKLQDNKKRNVVCERSDLKHRIANVILFEHQNRCITDGKLHEKYSPSFTLYFFPQIFCLLLCPAAHYSDGTVGEAAPKPAHTDLNDTVNAPCESHLA